MAKLFHKRRLSFIDNLLVYIVVKGNLSSSLYWTLIAKDRKGLKCFIITINNTFY